MKLLIPIDASNDKARHEFNNNDSSGGRISTVRRKSKSYYFDDMSLGETLSCLHLHNLNLIKSVT